MSKRSKRVEGHEARIRRRRTREKQEEEKQEEQEEEEEHQQCKRRMKSFGKSCGKSIDATKRDN